MITTKIETNQFADLILCPNNINIPIPATRDSNTVIKFIEPSQLENNVIHEIILERVAVVWNNAWFLNIRSAYGLKFFGEQWKNEDLTKKSHQMVNTVLNLPRTNGIFPSLVLPVSYNAIEYSIINGNSGRSYKKR